MTSSAGQQRQAVEGGAKQRREALGGWWGGGSDVIWFKVFTTWSPSSSSSHFRSKAPHLLLLLLPLYGWRANLTSSFASEMEHVLIFSRGTIRICIDRPQAASWGTSGLEDYSTSQSVSQSFRSPRPQVDQLHRHLTIWFYLLFRVTQLFSLFSALASSSWPVEWPEWEEEVENTMPLCCNLQSNPRVSRAVDRE